MEFTELAAKRYSVRKFLQQKVEQKKIDVILEAGRLAPTAHNFQPQRILVIQSEEGLAKVKECTKSHFHAPLVFLICYDKETCWVNFQGRKEGIVDASIVTTHMMYAAEQLGLGSTWVGAFHADKAIEVFNIPSNLEPVAMLPVGYPAESAQPSPLHYERFPIEKTVFYDTFNGAD